MTFKQLKTMVLVTASCMAFSLQGLPTHKEIIDELAAFRKATPQLNDSIRFNDSASYYMDRVDEAKVLDKTTGWFDYCKKYATFWFPVMAARSMMNMAMISKDTAPKTYELIEHIAKKMGFQEVPLIYLAANEKFFNAFATGLLQSMSIVVLGEKMVLELYDLESLEFLIAHELSHIKNYHIPKRIAVGILTNYAYNLMFPSSNTTTNFPTPIDPSKTTTLTEKQLKEFAIQRGKEIAQSIMQWIIKGYVVGLVTSWYSRTNEKDADLTAAHYVGAQGGVDFAKMVDEKTGSHVNRDFTTLEQGIEKTSLKDSKIFALRVGVSKAFSRTYEAISNVMNNLNPYRTHPTHEQRIAYLQEFLKNNPAPAAAAPAN